MSKRLDKSVKVKGSTNIVLNAIGNISGWISYMFLKPSMRWGTWYELDMSDDDYAPEYEMDEIW
jgi:hypothetical protein